MKRVWWPLTLAFTLTALAGCEAESTLDADASDGANASSSGSASDSGGASDSVDSEQAGTRIVLGSEIVVSGELADAVHVTEGRVLITAAGSYALQGEASGVVVDVAAADADVTLVLDGVQLENQGEPAIVFSSSASSRVVINEGTRNQLAGGSEEYDAALYSVASLSLEGAGALHVNGNVQEGIASEMHLYVKGGEISVEAVDDGLNANRDGESQIVVSGGRLVIKAGGDGIDSNGSIQVIGGTVIAASVLSSDPNTGLDADLGVRIDGGVVVATGARGPGGGGGPGGEGSTAESSQPSLTVNASARVEAGTLVVAVDGDGTPVMAFQSAQAFQQIVLSHPRLVSGAEYTLYSGGAIEGEVQDGLYDAITSYELGNSLGTVSAE